MEVIVYDWRGGVNEFSIVVVRSTTRQITFSLIPQGDMHILTLNATRKMKMNRDFVAIIIRSQTPNSLPDRKALDDIVFDILGLTQQERNEVYWAVCELVKNRLEKAKSV
jgi:hypothetical protein